MKKRLIIISGPTATGKSDLSVDLALTLFKEKKRRAIVVNFDSLQFYQELLIGTARLSIEEMKGVEHYLVGTHSIKNPLSAADFRAEAKKIVEEALKKNLLVILVGGSGFYLNALLKGMYDSPKTSESLSQKSEKLYSEQGIAPFLKELSEVDPLSYKRIHPNDHYRIRRAVEHFWAHQTPFSQVQNVQDCWLNDVDMLHLYLDVPKKDHAHLIVERTKRMLQNGLLKEVENLLAKGFLGDERPLLSIGYKEVLAFLRKEISSLSELEEKIVIATRQLAKAQRTWFKRIQDKENYNPLVDKDKITSRVIDWLEE